MGVKMSEGFCFLIKYKKCFNTESRSAKVKGNSPLMTTSALFLLGFERFSFAL